MSIVQEHVQGNFALKILLINQLILYAVFFFVFKNIKDTVKVDMLLLVELHSDF